MRKKKKGNFPNTREENLLSSSVLDCTLDNEENGCKEHSLFCVRVKKSHCQNEVKCRIRHAVPTNDRAYN